MHHIDQEIDRFQLSMMDLESMVAQNSYARLVDLFVDSLPFDKQAQRACLSLWAQIKVFIANKGSF